MDHSAFCVVKHLLFAIVLIIEAFNASSLPMGLGKMLEKTVQRGRSGTAVLHHEVRHIKLSYQSDLLAIITTIFVIGGASIAINDYNS